MRNNIDMDGIQFFQARRIFVGNAQGSHGALVAIQEAGNNSFLLASRDVFLDMLTDSGSNAMSEKQYAAMMLADDSYAGSETFFRLKNVLCDIFGMKHFLPAYQKGALAKISSQTSFIKPGDVTVMNYHFTTTKTPYYEALGESAIEVAVDDALKLESDCLFKGNFDIRKLDVGVLSESQNNFNLRREPFGRQSIFHKRNGLVYGRNLFFQQKTRVCQGR
jgi:tryptophanase